MAALQWTATPQSQDNLELESQRKLHLASQPGAGDRPEVPRADLIHRRVERRPVSEIVILPPELDLLVLCDREILENGEVDADQPGRYKDITAAVSVTPTGGCERRGIEPPRDTP